MLAVLRSNDTRVNTNINREFKSVLSTFRWFYHEKNCSYFDRISPYADCPVAKNDFK